MVRPLAACEALGYRVPLRVPKDFAASERLEPRSNGAIIRPAPSNYGAPNRHPNNEPERDRVTVNAERAARAPARPAALTEGRWAKGQTDKNAAGGPSQSSSPSDRHW